MSFNILIHFLFYILLDLETSSRETTADECILRSSSVSKEVEIVISDLMKISSYDLNGQRKLHDALSEV